MGTSKRSVLAATLVAAVLLTGCAGHVPITKTSINANAELLKPASAEVAKGANTCESTTSSRGWLLRFIGLDNKVKSTVTCS